MSTSPYPSDVMAHEIYSKESSILIDKYPYTQFTFPEDATHAKDKLDAFLQKWSPIAPGSKILVHGAYAESTLLLPRFNEVAAAALKYCCTVKEGKKIDIQFVFCVKKPTKGFDEERAFNSGLQLVAYPECASNKSHSPMMVLSVEGVMGLGIDFRHVTSDSELSNFRNFTTARLAAYFFPETTKHLAGIVNQTTPVKNVEGFIQDLMKNFATIHVPAEPQSNEADFMRVTQVAAKYELAVTLGNVNSLGGVVYAKPESISAALNAMTRALMNTTDTAAQKAAAQNLIIGHRFFNGDESLAYGTYCPIGETRSFFIGDVKMKIGAYIKLGAAGYLFRILDEVENGLTTLLDLLTSFIKHDIMHEEAALYERPGDAKKKIYAPDTSFGGDRIHSRAFVLQTPKRFNPDGTRAPDVAGKNAQHHAVQIVLTLLRGGKSYDREHFHAVCDRLNIPQDKRVFVSQPAVYTDSGSILVTSAELHVDNVLFAARKSMEAAFDTVSGDEDSLPPSSKSPAMSGRTLSAST